MIYNPAEITRISEPAKNALDFLIANKYYLSNAQNLNEGFDGQFSYIYRGFPPDDCNGERSLGRLVFWSTNAKIESPAITLVHNPYEIDHGTQVLALRRKLEKSNIAFKEKPNIEEVALQMKRKASLMSRLKNFEY